MASDTGARAYWTKVLHTSKALAVVSFVIHNLPHDDIPIQFDCHPGGLEAKKPYIFYSEEVYYQ